MSLVVPNRFHQPTLLPNTGPPEVRQDPLGRGAVVSFGKPLSTDADPAFTRAVGTLTVTVGGTITNLDTVTPTFTAGLFVGGVEACPVVNIVTADTVTTVAEKIAASINSDAALQSLGVSASAGGAAGAVVTISWPGPVGAQVTVTMPKTGTTETYTLSSATPVGGSGPVIPWANAIVTLGSVCIRLRMGIPMFFDYPAISLLVAGGQPIA